MESNPQSPARSRTGAAGAGLGSALRLLKSKDQKQRVFRATLAGFQAFGKSVAKVFIQLWHQVTGFVFLCFAVVCGSAAIREYHAYQAGKIGPGKTVLAVLFTLMFFYFGMSNFLRARK